MITIILATVILIAVIIIAIHGNRNIDNFHNRMDRIIDEAIKDAKKYKERLNNED